MTNRFEHVQVFTPLSQHAFERCAILARRIGPGPIPRSARSRNLARDAVWSHPSICDKMDEEMRVLMASISIDEQTRNALAGHAERLGLSVEEYLRRLSSQLGTLGNEPELSGSQIECLLDELAIDVTPLPDDFSRADVYLGHD
jgi:hypothetical protein